MHNKRAVLDEFLEAVTHIGSNLLGGLAVNAVFLQVRNPLFLRFNALPKALDGLIRFVQVFEIFLYVARDL
ncbi:hypothetical protein RM96_21705 [Cupriavidus sp. IDO]|nr:hypothetical protein RM96_21705 [Cupriavidus sp. IDO]